MARALPGQGTEPGAMRVFGAMSSRRRPTAILSIRPARTTSGRMEAPARHVTVGSRNPRQEMTDEAELEVDDSRDRATPPRVR